MQMAKNLLTMLYVSRKLYRLRANGVDRGVGLQSIYGAPTQPDFSGYFNSCFHLRLDPALDEICSINNYWGKLQARAALGLREG